MKATPSSILRFLLWGFCLAPAGSGLLATVPLFESEEPVIFTLEIPVKQLKAQRGEAIPEYLDGLATWQGHEIELRVEARGNFRRQETSCDFPPYWINFKRKQTKDTVFDGVNKIKVVSHCREGWSSFAPHVHREYLAYQTYRLVTDLSFRVRLAEITYIDSESGNSYRTDTAFFIEPVDVLEDRLQAKEFEDRYILPKLYDQDALALAEFFQYFVGNSDFSFFASQDKCCHNGKAFAPTDGDGGLIPVPYDFDMAGIVNAPYATIAPGIPIKSVTQRYYRGTRKSQELFDSTVAHYLSREEAIMQLWQETDLLPKRFKRASLKFIEDFFTVLKSDDLRHEEIVKRTRSPEAIEGSLNARMSLLEQEEKN